MEETGPDLEWLTPIEVSRSLVSAEALLKACYWFSRDFECRVMDSGENSRVYLTPKSSPKMTFAEVKDAFLSHAVDFSLREKISTRTSDVRELLLAKAFAESGVLEEKPTGMFGDAIEEAKPDGMFNILNR